MLMLLSWLEKANLLFLVIFFLILFYAENIKCFSSHSFCARTTKFYRIVHPIPEVACAF